MRELSIIELDMVSGSANTATAPARARPAPSPATGPPAHGPWPAAGHAGGWKRRAVRQSQKETNGMNRSVAALPALLGDKGLLLHHGCGFYGAESVVFSAATASASVR